jgi:chromosome segregation ATPase
LFLRAAATYQVNLNPESPLGTISSIEHVLRSLERRAEEERQDIERNEKALSDYKAQLGRPYEHEARLQELLARQAQLNASLDLDKSDRQVVAESPEPEDKSIPAGFLSRIRPPHSEVSAMTP